jgi:hypothetical protein
MSGLCRLAIQQIQISSSRAAKQHIQTVAVAVLTQSKWPSLRQMVPEIVLLILYIVWEKADDSSHRIPVKFSYLALQWALEALVVVEAVLKRLVLLRIEFRFQLPRQSPSRQAYIRFNPQINHFELWVEDPGLDYC